MRPRLITNADDFGLTRGINIAIAELHDAGAVTSATLMASGTAFGHAVTLARARPTLGLGCHIVLTDGLPISPPRAIPTLVPGGRFLRPKLVHFVAALLANQIDPSDIEREAVAQIRRVQQAGFTLTHVDTHKHTHIFPQVLGPLLRAALRTGVPAVRNPFEQPWAFPLSNGTPARTSQLRLLQPLKRRFLQHPAIRSRQIRTTDGTLGISATGHLDEVTLRNLLQALPGGTWELVCHPGYNDADLDQVTTRLRSSRDVEREALLAVLSKSASQEVGELAGWQLSNSAPQLADTGLEESSHASPQPPSPELIHYGNLFADLSPEAAESQFVKSPTGP